MIGRTRWLISGALALGLVGAGVGVGLAETGSTSTPEVQGTDVGHADTDGAEVENRDSDQPLTGSDLERASAAALDAVGGGTVTDSEIDDGGAAFSVEVRKDDGSQVEVQLDAAFAVIGTETDDD